MTPNIEVGDILAHKGEPDKYKCKVLAVYDGLYAISELNDYEDFSSWVTSKQIKENYILCRKPFKPVALETYWYVGTNESTGTLDAKLAVYDDSTVDKTRIEQGNCFEKQEDAETKAKKVTDKLKEYTL